MSRDERRRRDRAERRQRLADAREATGGFVVASEELAAVNLIRDFLRRSNLRIVSAHSFQADNLDFLFG